jgi:hypothetical protein
MLKKKLTADLRALTVNEVETIAGVQGRQAMRLMSQIRKHFNKRKRAKIVVSEFCLYTGYKEEAVLEFLEK